ncbi:RCC1/BLIP-II [Viridothelium virens]|uniref:RCC1/BLIP-II n=1 Tax=Viridothelium virens TaxID=1048519 RepID=A0A6A6HPA9_VIRVR|nr:RCC1/BLIP-II [Viridothelium virens]
MRSLLWKTFYQDDVDSFRHLLETASYNVRDRAHAQKGHGSGQSIKSGAIIGSPVNYLATTPVATARTRKSGGDISHNSGGVINLTRADVNSKDANGLTLLHHAATGDSDQSLDFATALLQHPLTDLYVQDSENGWTALHRAFYFGNISIALAILNREAGDLLGHSASNASKTLIKIKDREGHGPFDVLGATVQDHRITTTSRAHRATSSSSEEDTNNEGGEGEACRGQALLLALNLQGDEVFTFGSNKNITLGFGDEDDRHFPERVTLRRPLHLLQRFYKESIKKEAKRWSTVDPAYSETLLAGTFPPKPAAELPAVIRSIPVVIQDVRMSKLHTAVLTTDPESNLYVCGHGPGGRLGTGSEITQFGFVCIEGGALAHKRVSAVALGHHHTLALSDDGETFSWGSNGFGQLGYALPNSPGRDDDPIQTLPRQIFGPLKREGVVGIAASRIHSVAFTASSLYTFGKNEGQLGIVDSDARSLTLQIIPRKVAASLFSSPIISASAIDRATVCLLDNHDVWVFANYGYAKLSFPLGAFSNYFLKDSFLATRYDTQPTVVKVVSGGDTICALSSAGEIYTVSITNNVEGPVSNTSTTNPSKIRSALSHPHKIWSPRKGYMRAKDVSVDQDGSIILTTEAGSAWRRIRRAKAKDASASGTGEYQPKDYKFSRIPSLTRVIAVRASGYGAYSAVRRDCDIVRSSIVVEDKTLWKDLLPLLPFYSLIESAPESDSEDENPPPRFWRGSRKTSDTVIIRQRILEISDLEKEILELTRQSANHSKSTYDITLGCTTSDVRIPVHSFLLCGRSKVISNGLAQFRHSGFFAIPDVLSIEYDKAGDALAKFTGIDFLSLVDFVLYLYTDTVVDFWHYTRRAPKLAFRYRQIRTELMKLASKLELPHLESAVRQMIEPRQSLNMDLERAFRDGLLEADGDVIVQLEDAEVRVQSALICQRCPFFEGLFNGRAGGRWLDDRRRTLNDASEAVAVDLKHIESDVFTLVLRHIYADTDEELFDDIVSDDFDAFLDLVIDVMGVANELMLDRLSQICQKVLGRYVTIRNVASFLNAVAPTAVSQFKDAGLEYLSLSLEAVLENAYALNFAI